MEMIDKLIGLKNEIKTTKNKFKLDLLKGELKIHKKEFQKEMFKYIQEEFKKRGFIADPRGDVYYRFLYNPQTKVSISIGNITTTSVDISVIDMVNDGLEWGTAYRKLNTGTAISFNFTKKTFDDFYYITYTNRVNKLNKLMVD